MQVPGQSSKPARGPSVHSALQGLGLRTYNSEPRITRAVFKHDAVIRLYREGLPSLFGILCRDEGSVLSRDDPTLLNAELDQLLQEYGPLIWPHPSEGSRDHLHAAQIGTLYETDFVYPRDASALKSHLRQLILAKKAKPGVNYQVHIAEKYGDDKLQVPRKVTSLAPTTPIKSPFRTMPVRRSAAGGGPSTMDVSDGSDSEDSIMGTTTRQRAFLETENSHKGFASVQLRLYRKTKPNLLGTNGPVFAYEPLFIGSDCTTAYDCFNSVCEQIATDCSFMIFELPEDMSQNGSVRLDRGSSNAETTFQRLRSVFRRAKRFPGNPQYRSVEVEIGLDMPLHDGFHNKVPILPCDDSSSSLSSPPSSESLLHDANNSVQSAIGAKSTSSTVLRGQSFECFSHLSNARGHYYSALAMCARGVWIGYLAPNNQKKSYRGLPSYQDLKTNFVDMNLPCPPSNPGTPANNRGAVCRGCFGDQSALLTLREMSFVKDRNLVIMPLDGEDDMGMFCILLPQPMDRSMKSLQAWRPYEVNNGGDGKKFGNNFMLFTLRSTSIDAGTVETVYATLHPRDTTILASQPVAKSIVTPAPAATPSIQPNTEEEDSDESLMSQKARAARKRSSRSSSDHATNENKRKRTGATILRLPEGKPNHLSSSEPISSTQDTLSTTSLTSAREEKQTAGRQDSMPQTILPVNDTQSSSSRTVPPAAPVICLADEQALNISIIWSLEMDGEVCDFPLTMAECKSFSEMLETLREMVQSLPAAAAMLEKTDLWGLTYMLPSGTKKTQMARPGTEVAFNRMRTELAQCASMVGDSMEIELKAVV